MSSEKKDKCVTLTLMEELKSPKYSYQAMEHDGFGSVSLSSNEKPVVDDEVAKKSNPDT